jgi:hypothetical protein
MEASKVDCSGEKTDGLYGVPHGILRGFNTILYENEFQSPQIFQQTISLFPEHSSLSNLSGNYVFAI